MAYFIMSTGYISCVSSLSHRDRYLKLIKSVVFLLFNYLERQDYDAVCGNLPFSEYMTPEIIAIFVALVFVHIPFW